MKMLKRTLPILLIMLCSFPLFADTQVFGNNIDEVKGKSAELSFQVDFSNLFVLEAGIAEIQPVEGNIEDAKSVSGVSLETKVENGVITASKTIYPFWRIKSNDSYEIYLSSHTDQGGPLKGDLYGEEIDWHATWTGESTGDLGKGGNYYRAPIHQHGIMTKMDEGFVTVDISVPSDSEAGLKRPDVYRTVIIISIVPKGGT